MGKKARKLLERMRQSKSGWGANDLLTLYEGFGFTIRQGRRHAVITHPERRHLRTVLPRHAKGLSEVYVSIAIAFVEEVVGAGATEPDGEA